MYLNLQNQSLIFNMNKVIFILLLCLTSCANFTRQMHLAALKGNLYAVRNGTFIHDQSTGLCFFVIDAYQGASITRVPCDSLKNVFVEKMYIQRQ